MAIDENEALVGLMDALLPGGAGFPAASATGMAALLAARLRHADAALPGRLAASLAAAEAPKDSAAWHDAAAKLQASEPELFDELRKYAYLTYYEQPDVIAAIRALGFRYNDAPLPAGYPDEPFDVAKDAPRHARGRWVPTDAVQRVDLEKTR
jgi:hypothetical protein